MKFSATTAPLVISASRATDIPAFHGRWLIERLKNNYVSRVNPFNGKTRLIDLRKVKAIVFWTKNPEPFLPFLNYLDKHNYIYYFLYTLNDYEHLEKNLPALEKRIECFKILSDKLGSQRVIWRFDPVVLGGQWSISSVLERLDKLGRHLSPYCEKMVFSFFEKYPKVSRRLKQLDLDYLREAELEEKNKFVRSLSVMNKQWPNSLQLASCAQDLDLSAYGIEKNRCVDGHLICRLAQYDEVLLRHFGLKRTLFDILDESSALKDKGQRRLCQCGPSQDIGFYNSCGHYCAYCYANA